MALRIGPFVLSRSVVSQAEFADLLQEGMEAILPVPDLLTARGIRRGQLTPGEARRIERDVCLEQLDAVRAQERRLTEVRVDSAFAPLHAVLSDALRAYGDTLRAYAAAGRAVERADVDAYREHNRNGQERDAAACESVTRLLRSLDEQPAQHGIEPPETLRRISSKAEAYRRLMGGAIAFWE